MTTVEIITLFVTVLCLLSFCAVFTILFHHYYKSNTEAVASGKEDIELIDNAIDEEKEKKSGAKKALKITGKVGSYVLLGAVFCLFAFSLASKITGNAMMFGDATMVVIASGSMSERNNETIKSHPELTNQFDAYDIIGISRYKSQDEIALYDVIAYKNKNDVTIVHRIVGINEDEKTGEITYLTQGDSNLYADNTNASQYTGYLAYEKIVGKYDGRRMKGIGVFVIFLQSSAGIVTVVSVFYCLLMYDFLASRYHKAILERTDMLVKLIDYDLSKGEGGDVLSDYRETLFYKNQLYTFQNGKFIKKEESDAELKKLNDHMVLIKKENGKASVTVKDTRDNTTKTYEGVSEEDCHDLSKFIPGETPEESDE